MLFQVQLIHLLRKLIHESHTLQDRAAVIVMHDLNLVARVADSVALIVAGRLEAFGTPREVLTADILGKAYQVSLGVIQDPETGASVIIPHF